MIRTEKEEKWRMENFSGKKEKWSWRARTRKISAVGAIGTKIPNLAAAEILRVQREELVTPRTCTSLPGYFYSQEVCHPPLKLA